LGAEGREQSPGLDDHDDRHHTRGHTQALAGVDWITALKTSAI
jgi:hypothetical protein